MCQQAVRCLIRQHQVDTFLFDHIHDRFRRRLVRDQGMDLGQVTQFDHDYTSV